MKPTEHENNPLWSILEETVHALLMFQPHRNYVKNVVLKEKPDATPEHVRDALGIPLGEALIILYELQKEQAQDSHDGEEATTR